MSYFEQKFEVSSTIAIPWIYKKGRIIIAKEATLQVRMDAELKEQAELLYK